MKKQEVAKKMGEYHPAKHPSRTFPLKGEVSEARKHRGDKVAEKELGDYRRYKSFSKASGTWGGKNTLEEKYNKE